MTGAEEDDRSAAGGGGRLSTLARTVTLRQVLVAAATVVVLASGAFGGLAAADRPGTPTTRPGDTVTASPFEVTVDRARWVTDLGPSIPTPRGRYVALVATLTNTSDHPVAIDTVRQLLRLSDLDGALDARGEAVPDSAALAPRVHVTTDSVELTQAQPGLTYDVVFLWDQSAEVDPPTEVTFVLRSQTWRASTVDDQMMWLDPTTSYEGTLAVEPGGQESS